MEKLLTISVAAYNVEQYIRKTLESFCIDEVLPYIEVFVVDDGARDSSFMIAKEFETRFPDSFVAVHKENGGWGSTVNYSIEHATGRYFRLCDGDDYYDGQGLVELIGVLKTADADVIYTPYRRFDDSSGKTVENIAAKNGCPIGRNVCVSELNGMVDFVMHSTCFKTSILQNNHISIREHCFYTDNEYRAKGMAYADVAYVMDVPVYQYRVGREGQSIDIQGLQKHYRDNLKVLLELSRFIKDFEKSDAYQLLLGYFKNGAMFQYEALIRLGLEQEIKEFDSWLKELGAEFFENDSKVVKRLRKKDFSNVRFYAIFFNFRSKWAAKIKMLINAR